MFYSEQLVAEAQTFAQGEWEKVRADLAQLVGIDSAKGDPEPGAPYGPGPRRALDVALQLAQSYGLDAHAGDGHMGYADLLGAAAAGSRKQLGIIGHLDVVPAGSGWDSDPFEMTEREGLYVGRGVGDDKGPLVCALHAVRFWIERNERTGQAFPHDLRLLFGCDEESGMSDADWYLAHYDAPDFLFTPDAEFPVCYGEKGQFQALIKSRPVVDGALLSFEAGQAVNAVPGLACAVVKAPAGHLASTTQVEVEPQPGVFADGSVPFKLTAHGVAGHAAMPEGSDSALRILADYLLAEDVCTAAENEWLAFARDAAAQNDGSLFGMDTADKDFGPLTCVAGCARLVPAEDDAPAGALRFSMTLDCRFPTTVTAPSLLGKVAAYLDRAHVAQSIEPLSMVEPLLVDPETAPVRALRDAYRLASGRDAAPVTMGGGTYAHHFPVGTSFGAEDFARFPRPAWAGGMHAANEAVPVAELQQALVAYIVAIGLLMDGPLA